MSRHPHRVKAKERLVSTIVVLQNPIQMLASVELLETFADVCIEQNLLSHNS